MRRESTEIRRSIFGRSFRATLFSAARGNAKWYAAILTVKVEKLGLTDDCMLEVIDLRGEPEFVARIPDGERFFPGYHMNKKHWFTVLLDGSVPDDEICRLLDESYVLAAK